MHCPRVSDFLPEFFRRKKTEFRRKILEDFFLPKNAVLKGEEKKMIMKR
jgi:hypothetical protein